MVEIPGRRTDRQNSGYAEYVECLEKAFSLSCDKLSDGPQAYEEATTADGWAALFMERAKKIDVLKI